MRKRFRQVDCARDKFVQVNALKLELSDNYSTPVWFDRMVSRDENFERATRDFMPNQLLAAMVLEIEAQNNFEENRNGERKMIFKLIGTKTILAGASAVLMTGTAAAAATGSLPTSVQNLMSLTASSIGIAIPASNSHSSPELPKPIQASTSIDTSTTTAVPTTLAPVATTAPIVQQTTTTIALPPPATTVVLPPVTTTCYTSTTMGSSSDSVHSSCGDTSVNPEVTTTTPDSQSVSTDNSSTSTTDSNSSSTTVASDSASNSNSSTSTTSLGAPSGDSSSTTSTTASSGGDN